MKKNIISVVIGLWLSLSATAMAFMPPDDFNLKSLGGDNVKLSDYRGKVVLVNFWASWCPPCVHELPSMQALYDELAGQPFEVLALNMTEDEGMVYDFLKSFSTELKFPILMNADKTVANEWRVQGLPTTVLIDKNGLRALTWQGSRDWNSAEVRELLQPLLDD